MQNKKGFTIIELLVVIAIIAVLATIVLVNVTQYTNKGKDASAKGNLATLLTNGAIYFNSFTNYTGFNTSASYNSVYNRLTTSGMSYTVIYSGNTTNYCTQLTLKSGNTYCVDSTGKKLEKSGGTCSSSICN